MTSILGIDGGGSGSRAILVSGEGEVLWRGKGEAANCRSAGLDELAGTLNAIREAAVEGGHEIHGAGIGLAGVVDQATADSVAGNCAKDWGLKRGAVRVEPDIRIAHRGALPEGIGIVLISGTGSSCLGRNEREEWHLCGGWGSVLDDAGSGYRIGLEALRRVVEMEDGRLEETPLRGSMLSALGMENPKQLVLWIHSGKDRKMEISGLFPHVVELARRGDRFAREILEEAVEALVKMVRPTADKLQLASPQVVLLGGVAGSETGLKIPLIRALATSLPGICHTEAFLPPEAGGVLLGWEVRGMPISREWLSALKEQLLKDEPGR